MKTTLEHLPATKQQELSCLVQLICQHDDVEMIVLFGSYARGDWVEELAEDNIHFQYQSDFDLLVIIAARSTTKQNHLEFALKEAINKQTGLNTPVSLIVHDLTFINRRLLKAQYFFSDIQKEGIVLYDSGKFKLEQSRQLHPKDRYQLAQEDFDYWFESAQEFWKDYENCMQRGSYNNAAFMLHQVTEKLYSTILLVFTRYKPNTHDLETLRKLVNALDQHFVTVFTLNTDDDKHRFKLLCKAYVDARYKKSYLITKEILMALEREVKVLMQCTEKLCHEKIAHFLNEID